MTKSSFKRKKTGLVPLVAALAVSCGTEITKIDNHFYGPDGEETSTFNGGGCETFGGKYLWDLSGCDIGTDKPIGDDCVIEILQGYSGNRIPLQMRGRGFDALDTRDNRGTVYHWRFIFPSEFDKSNVVANPAVPEGRAGLIDRFMCYLRVNPNLLVMTPDPEAPRQIEVYDASLVEFRDEPYSFAKCTRIDRDPDYNSCKINH